MKFSAVFLAFATFQYANSASIANNTGSLSSNPQLGIVGGSDAPLNEGKHHVEIHYQGFGNRGPYGGSCGGSLIDQYTVLSAAHCVQGGMIEVFVRYGTHNSANSAYYDIPVDPRRWRAYPGFGQPAQPGSVVPLGDVSILKLSSPIPEGKDVSYIKMEKTYQEFSSKDTFTLYGFGRINPVESADGQEQPSIRPEHLQKEITENASKDEYNRFTAERGNIGVIITKEDNGNACYGDSGSGLIHNNKLVGIVSGSAAPLRSPAAGKCFVGEPVLYSSVAFPHHMNWIEHMIQHL